MSELLIQQTQGFTKEEAFQDLPFNITNLRGVNATRSWKISGSPLPNTPEFAVWAKNQLQLKTRNLPGFGLFIVYDSYTPDNRISPCTIENSKTDGKSTWKLEYWVQDPVTSTIISKVANKAQALKIAQKLTLDNHTNYSILRLRVPDRNIICGTSTYTPSASAKKGTFIAFGYGND